MKDTYADAPDLAYRRREAAHDKSAVLATGIRRGIDIGLSVLLLVLLAPLYVAVCLAILIGSGRPVHFRQARVGRGGVSSASTSSAPCAGRRIPAVTGAMWSH